MILSEAAYLFKRLRLTFKLIYHGLFENALQTGAILERWAYRVRVNERQFENGAFR